MLSNSLNNIWPYKVIYDHIKLYNGGEAKKILFYIIVSFEATYCHFQVTITRF